ncbi:MULTISPECIES: hypothetical protein [unclassified Flavobacterium]|nr:MULTISPECIES: hypothetical protein [unclassified Flavobacterium]WPO80248.1 hypothetical protein SCB73_07650 [Flavobacterium sp. KACC 22761]
MLVELKNTELVEINGGCQDCYDNGAKLRKLIGIAWDVLMAI